MGDYEGALEQAQLSVTAAEHTGDLVGKARALMTIGRIHFFKGRLAQALTCADEAAATGRAPNLYRPAGGLSRDAVRAEAGRQGLAEILWDVIPFDWINDSNTAATIYMLKTQIKPGSVVLLHDTYSSTVDLVYQFLPVLIANGYHMVTVSHLLGDRTPGSSYGGRENGPPANAIVDISAARIPTLPNAPSPKPAPNLPITDIPNQSPGGPPA